MQYTTEQYIAELEKRKKTINKAKIIFGCATAAHNSQINRMRNEQLNSEGESLVGSYSTKPMYMSPYSSHKKVTPIGKNGETVFKSGKKHKTQYIAGGYKQFKEIIGRPMFEVWGDLFSDFTNSIRRKDDYFVSGLRDLNVEGEGNEKKTPNSKKFLNLIKKYGKKSFMLTKDEKTNYSNCINRKLNNILRGETANV